MRREEEEGAGGGLLPRKQNDGQNPDMSALFAFLRCLGGCARGSGGSQQQPAAADEASLAPDTKQPATSPLPPAGQPPEGRPWFEGGTTRPTATTAEQADVLGQVGRFWGGTEVRGDRPP